MKHLRLVLGGIAALNVIACGSSQNRTPGLVSNLVSMPASHKAAVRLELTDAPNDNIKSVYVSVKHAELRVSGGSKAARMIVGEDMGVVDLLTLRDGVTMPMGNVTLPAGSEITQIRLVLNETGNFIVMDNGDTCELRTPSAQRTGIKMLIHGGLPVDGGHTYRIISDFDAEKSVVLTGNGGCLLKPVLKLKSVTRVETPPPAEEPPAEEPGEEPVPSTGDNSGDPDGWEEPGEDPVPYVPGDDLDWYML